MTNRNIRQGGGSVHYIKATGTGTLLDPFVEEVSIGGGTVTTQGTITVSSPDTVVSITPALGTTVYAASALLFDATEVASAVRAASGCAILQSVTVCDKDDMGAAFTLVLASGSTTFGTVGSACAISDAGAAAVLGFVPIATSDYIDLGGARVACIRNLGLALKAGTASASVWAAGINGSGTPLYSSSGMVLSLGFLRA